MILDYIEKTTLSNGIKVIVCPKKDTPVISVQVWYDTGSINDRNGTRGISHVLEHMMFRGSKNIPSEKHAQRINDVGGHCNAFTAEDVTAYLNSIPKDHFDMVLKMEADRMQNLTFDNKLFETERNVIIEEYHTYMNNPVAKAFLEFRTIFYKGHPYEVSPLGYIDDIKSITIDDLIEYYKTWYRADNATIIIVGDIETPQNVFDKVSDIFGQIDQCANKNIVYQKKKSIPKLNIGNSFIKRKVDFDVPIFICGYESPDASSEDVLPLDILQIIIGQGETSRLHSELVRKKGIAVMTTGMNHSLKYSGMNLFFAVFTPDINYRTVEKAINYELNKIKNDGISELEMEKVKNMTMTYRTFDLYSADNICQKLGYSEVVDGNYKKWVEKMDRLQSLSRDQLMFIAQKYWQDSKKHSLLLQPKKINPLIYGFGLLRRFTGKRS